MKYVFIIPDGLADLPLEDLDGKTPVEVARTPNLDRLAREGACGMARNVPKSLPPGSDVACLSLLGFDPKKYYTGRGPLEAASQNILLKEDELAFRCNLVTIFQNKMIDYSGGHISSKEGRVLIEKLNQTFCDIQGISFYPGVSYRNLAVISEALLQEGKGELMTVAPHDILDKDIDSYVPKGKGSAFLI
ncbi:MAG: phosphoglycerate mutase, partial [Candidatus Aureabacteria bacterium]|nr:phosphoglycerate mutase [Candidatus Auribacterota bacterium]